ncbi:MAG: hypothetical protein ABII09_11275 [Planctomycetota bacterium]
MPVAPAVVFEVVRDLRAGKNIIAIAAQANSNFKSLLAGVIVIIVETEHGDVSRHGLLI